MKFNPGKGLKFNARFFIRDSGRAIEGENGSQRMTKSVKKGNFTRGINSWAECWVHLTLANTSKNEILLSLISFVIGDLGKDTSLNSVRLAADQQIIEEEWIQSSNISRILLTWASLSTYDFTDCHAFFLIAPL